MTSILEHVVRMPVSSMTYLADRSRMDLLMDIYNSSGSSRLKQHQLDSAISKNNKRVDSLAVIRDHVRLAPKISETVRGKLCMGATILQVGGLGKVFKKNFNPRDGEKLLKAFQCCLSTTAGPIAGLLFISTDKIAFRSERPIKISSSTGEEGVRLHYKVSIPLKQTKAVYESRNVYRPSDQYLDIVTDDNFDFWFMGFINYRKAFNYLQQAISQSHNLSDHNNMKITVELE